MKKILKWSTILFAGFVLLCILFPGDHTKRPPQKLCENAQEVKDATGGKASDEKLLAMGLCDLDLERENLEAMKSDRYRMQ